jgi:hypothetical protein
MTAGTDDRIDALSERVDGLRDDWQRGRLEDRDKMRRLFLVQSEASGAQIKLIAEGHAVLAAGQDRIIERIDRLERDLTSLIMTAYKDLDRRKQDKRPARSRR